MLTIFLLTTAASCTLRDYRVSGVAEKPGPDVVNLVLNNGIRIGYPQDWGGSVPMQGNRADEGTLCTNGPMESSMVNTDDLPIYDLAYRFLKSPVEIRVVSNVSTHREVSVCKADGSSLNFSDEKADLVSSAKAFTVRSITGYHVFDVNDADTSVYVTSLYIFFVRDSRYQLGVTLIIPRTLVSDCDSVTDTSLHNKCVEDSILQDHTTRQALLLRQTADAARSVSDIQ